MLFCTLDLTIADAPVTPVGPVPTGRPVKPTAGYLKLLFLSPICTTGPDIPSITVISIPLIPTNRNVSPLSTVTGPDVGAPVIPVAASTKTIGKGPVAP
jgi:hypothetical protein